MRKNWIKLMDKRTQTEFESSFFVSSFLSISLDFYFCFPFFVLHKWFATGRSGDDK